MILPITLTMAGAATLLNIWLARRVGQVRMAHKVSVGDGGNEALTRRMRAQANFVEYTPFFLILLGLIELAKGSALWLWIVGAVYILARICHLFGMDDRGRLRMIGIIVTLLILLGLALYAIALPYLERGHTAGPSVQFAQTR
ncbi:MAG: MAPEG family protein [Alphaproteobacteria bacterium]|nr:MAG: MAPEG family protein [Alphaproteobacteria bacterium]